MGHKITIQQDAVGVILAAAVKPGQYGPNYELTMDLGAGAVVVDWLKQDKVDAQLQNHLGVTMEQVIDERIPLRIYRVPAKEPGKTYLNIDLADGPLTPLPAPPQPAPARSVTPITPTQAAAMLGAEYPAKPAQRAVPAAPAPLTEEKAELAALASYIRIFALVLRDEPGGIAHACNQADTGYDLGHLNSVVATIMIDARKRLGLR